MNCATRYSQANFNKGDAQKVWDKWIDKLATEMKAGKHLTIGTMKKNFHKICEDFSKVETTGEKKERLSFPKKRLRL